MVAIEGSDGSDEVAQAEALQVAAAAKGDKLGEAKAWRSIALAHEKVQETGPALWAAKMALLQFHEQGNDLNEAEMRMLTAKFHLQHCPVELPKESQAERAKRWGQASEALQLAGDAVEMCQARNEGIVMAQALSVMAQAQCVLGWYEEVFPVAKEACALNEANGDDLYEAGARMSLAKAHLFGTANFSPESAGEAAKRAQVLYQQCGISKEADNAEKFYRLSQTYQGGSGKQDTLVTNEGQPEEDLGPWIFNAGLRGDKGPAVLQQEHGRSEFIISEDEDIPVLQFGLHPRVSGLGTDVCRYLIK